MTIQVRMYSFLVVDVKILYMERKLYLYFQNYRVCGVSFNDRLQYSAAYDPDLLCAVVSSFVCCSVCCSLIGVTTIAVYMH